MQIDLNADLGEGAGSDEELLKLVSSANIACGWHAGDASTMRQCVRWAIDNQVAIGAHPSFPDRANFGRSTMHLPPEEIVAGVLYQVGALAAIVKAEGGTLAHVKAHGALYNMAAKDRALAEAIARAIRDVDAGRVLFALAGSELIGAAERAGLRCASEVFGDRTYQDDGSLSPRSLPGAMIEDAEVAAAQVKRMVSEGVVRSLSGKDVPVKAQTLCIHGDQPGALAFVRRIRGELAAAGIEVRAPA